MDASLKPLAAGAPRAAAAVVDALRLHDALPAGRPRAVGVMIASADGRAAVRGRSGPLGHPADRALLRTLRAAADAVVVGTRTLAAEKYANVLDGDQRAARAAAGRPELPEIVTVSRAGAIPDEIPVFAEPEATIRVYTGGAARVPSRGATVHVHALAPLTLRGALGHLRTEAGVEAVACEGGPTLLRALVAEELLDDLLLTISPLLVAGDEPAALAGPELDPAARLRLAGVHRADDHLFCHYRLHR
ncbi:MAG TPA: dihydrofolate reductase family protein [Solirubrobacteraceae bacterium]|nr:dihydrofolate reductase family protein [Solirubrobacteraceae bacterium]